MRRLSREEKEALLRHLRRKERRRIRRQLQHHGGSVAADATPESTEAVPQGEIITFYEREAEAEWRWVYGTPTVISCPEVFSFIDQPDETLRAIDRFVYAVRRRTDHIVLDQSRVQRTDLCAFSVLNVLAKSIGELIRRFDCAPPTSDDAREIWDAAGLSSVFGGPPPSEKFLIHPLVSGGNAPEKARRSSEKEEEATKLIEYLNRCFQRYGWSLPANLEASLSTLLTEVLGNAEDHTDRKRWWMSGYLRHENDAFGDLHLTLFNLGASIYESLTELPLDDPVRIVCDRTRATLKAAGGFRRGRFNDECFWTVAALQPRISSKSQETSSDSDRGTGTVRLIEAFAELGRMANPAQSPRMALISGRAHILFDGTHTLGPSQLEDGRIENRIAFNSQNSLRHPPDRKYVKALRRRFPGTLLSIRVYLDPHHLRHLSGTHSADH